MANTFRGHVKRGAEHLGVARHFAWPFGYFDAFSGEAARMVFEAGFESCASNERGCHFPGRGPVSPEELCLRRDHTIAAWPRRHVSYFMARNAQRADVSMGSWPDGWRANGGA